LNNYPLLYYDWKGTHGEMNDVFSDVLSNSANEPEKMISSSTIFNKLRQFKSEAEIAIMRKSAEISSIAMISAMRSTKAGMSESHIESILELECRLRGAQRLAYPPVVASGNNAKAWHYVQNTQLLKDGDILLVDAGCEYYQYPSDITRVWPVNGKFSMAQRELYEAVLRVQKKCIELCKPGMNFESLQQYAVSYITKELVDLKICDISTAESVN
jgi:Xaa-Pro aminopeptidase